jgi:hypothetical protein
MPLLNDIFNNYAGIPEMADCTACSGPDSLLGTRQLQDIPRGIYRILIQGFIHIFASGAEYMPLTRRKTPL